MKRILVIDDERTLKLEGEVNHARTSWFGEQLMVVLRSAGLRLDELWLDHDLGDDDTIEPIVNWLEETAYHENPYWVGQIMVHTINAPAGDRMMAALSPYYNTRRVGIEELSALCGAVLLNPQEA